VGIARLEQWMRDTLPEWSLASVEHTQVALVIRRTAGPAGWSAV